MPTRPTACSSAVCPSSSRRFGWAPARRRRSTTARRRRPRHERGLSRVAPDVGGDPVIEQDARHLGALGLMQRRHPVGIALPRVRRPRRSAVRTTSACPPSAAARTGPLGAPSKLAWARPGSLSTIWRTRAAFPSPAARSRSSESARRRALPRLAGGQREADDQARPASSMGGLHQDHEQREEGLDAEKEDARKEPAAHAARR